MAIKKLPHFVLPMLFLGVVTVFAQPIVTDPLSYAPIANPLPDTMNQLLRDSVNMKFSPIRLNQAGYRPQDKKFFYYVGTAASTFTVINDQGANVGTGSLINTGKSTSAKLEIKASNDATLVSGGDTRYLMNSPTFSGSIFEGVIPDLPSGAYQIVVGTEKSHPFVIDERVYSWVRDALLKFYGVNRCGESQSWFHEGCHLKDAVTGGWHDCGDHLKEGATMSYTAAVLGLAAAVFDDRDVDVYSANQGVTQITDGIPDILYEAKHGADFVLQSYDKAGGVVSKMVTSMGGFGNAGCGDDHSWWGRPEEQDYMTPDRGGPPRCARVDPTSDYLGKYAANLAFVSKRIRPYDAAYADRSLAVAKAIYSYTLPKLDGTNTAAYNGATIVTDDVAFGALALLWATSERKYLDDLCFNKTIGVKAQQGQKALFEGGLFTNNDPLFSKTSANTDWASNQTHVLWGFFRLILNDTIICDDLGLTEQQRLTLVEKTMCNLMANLSSVGLGNQTIPLPEGVLWVPSMVKYELPWFTMHTQMEWVWNRYQAGNITDMYYYYDIASRIQGVQLPNTPASTNWKADTIKTIIVRMMDYMIGVNPWDISMIYGIGDKNFNHPHHRAANPEGKNVPGAFYDYRPPVGALQGGYMPGATNVYNEHFNDWMHAETGIDGTTNILMPVLGLAKKDTISPPSGTVQIVYKGCDEAIVEVRQSRYGTAVIRYGSGPVPDKTVASDSAGVFHRFVLTGLTNGTAYNFDVVVTDLFERESIVKYIDEEKNAVYFSFTTLQNCPTDAQISNVKVCKVTSDSAEIFWYTPNGAFDSRVVYGEQKPPATVHEGDVADHPVKFHYVKIGNLKEKTTYYFYVESGDSRDDNNGQLYTFTTPVEHVEFDVRTLRYTWGGKPALGVNIVNQDSKAYDSLELRLYFRDKEGFENDLGARIDIMVLYRADGFQDTITGDLRRIIWNNLATQKPTKMPDTYDPADGTYAYYFAIPLWGVEMRSLSRIRMDVVFVRWEPDRHQDLLDEPPVHQITNNDWSFGPHSKDNGEPMDFPGVPVLPKEQVDQSYAKQPINYYVTVYRKNEYVWGYSPSQEELKTKKTHYTMESQVTSPLINPSADYVFYESKNARSVNVAGWVKVTPTDGTLNDIWINGVKQTDIASLFSWSSADERYNFTIPVPVQNGSNNVDITLFSGPPSTCDECYGCAVSNHSFNVDFRGAKLYPSTLVLRDPDDQPLRDTVRLDTTVFKVVLTDRNGNINGKAPDKVVVMMKNIDNGDSAMLTLSEKGDSTGIFESAFISVVDQNPDVTSGNQISMNGGDRVRIWYVDANDSLDMSEAFVYSKATFPQARRGYLKDQNGDGTVDLVVVEYSMVLKTPPDSLRVNFPTSTSSYLFPAGLGGMTDAGTQLQVVPMQPIVAGVTGFTSAAYGTGTSYLTSSGLVKVSEFKMYDSIGPVLNGMVTVQERETAGLDTISLTLSEAYRIADLKGNILLLRKAGVDHPVEVITMLGSESGTYTMTLLIDAKGQSMQTGDSLWLNTASAFADNAGNKPHVNNRRVPVVVKAALPSVSNAYYQDSNFDGVIDRAVLEYSKPVAPEQINIRLAWSDSDPVTIASSAITPISPNVVSIAIAPEFTFQQIVTGGVMTSATVFAASLSDTVRGNVADSAAPVIESGTFFLTGTPDHLTGEYLDTLEVIFTEPISFADSLQQLHLQSASTGAQYTFTIKEYLSVINDKVRLTGVVDVGVVPNTGDAVWLPANSLVADFRGNSQRSLLNRHAPVRVAEVKLSFKDVAIQKGPNPFCPQIGEKFKVIIKPIARFPMQLDSSAQAVIYDKVGNMVSKPLVIKVGSGVELHWDGTNKKGRFVGTGTYLMILTFKGEQEKIMVGVSPSRK